MDNQITGSQIGEGIQLLPVGSTALFCRLAAGFGFGNELAFRQHSNFAQGIFHAKGQRAFAEQDLSGLRQCGQGDAQEGG